MKSMIIDAMRMFFGGKECMRCKWEEKLHSRKRRAASSDGWRRHGGEACVWRGTDGSVKRFDLRSEVVNSYTAGIGVHTLGPPYPIHVSSIIRGTLESHELFQARKVFQGTMSVEGGVDHAYTMNACIARAA